MRPPVQATGDAGDVVQSNKLMLTGLSGTPAACSALIASTILRFGSGVANAAVAGTLVPKALPMVERRPSYPAKKKSLSFLSGPPTTPPNCSNSVGSFGLGAGLKRLRAAHEPLRPNAKAEP